MAKGKPCKWNDIEYSSVNKCAKVNCVSVGNQQWRFSQGYTRDSDMNPNKRRDAKVKLSKQWTGMF